MLIDVVYDFLCPWCLVGKRHLDLAIGQEQPAKLKVNWHQFMLYPHFDRGGHDFLEFFRERYGDELRVPMWDNIRTVAEPVGIHFSFEKITRGPASLDGHRLVRWAERQKPGSAAAMIEAISSSFFEKARVIDNDFLVEAAGRHGFDPVMARAYLEGEEDMAEPFAETQAWRQQGVTSMPHYTLTFQGGHKEVVKQTSVEIFADALRCDQVSARQVAV